MNKYETVFIMNPVLSEDQVRETVDKFKGIISTKGGQVTYTEDWGLRKMAYPIQKKKSGFYHMLEFQAPGSVIAEMEVEMKRDERLMRFLTVALDKHAVAWADERKKRVKSGK